jgi:hypothetical protein
MDESQIDKLGSKMRDVYADVAVKAPPVPAPKRPSRRLRKSGAFARASTRKASSPRGKVAGGGFVRQHPVASLLVVVGLGYLLARR